MRTVLRRCLRRHTGVAAYLALFLALAGTAYAAVTITGENIVDGSVRSVDIGDGEVRYADLATNSIRSTKVVDDSLQSHDIQDQSLTSSDIEDQSLTSDDIGSGAVRGSELELGRHVVSAQTAFDTNDYKSVEAHCPTGETAISAGVDLMGYANDGPAMHSLYPVDTNTWAAGMRSVLGQDQNWGIRLKVICVSI